jgi:hypothetical protein
MALGIMPSAAYDGVLKGHAMKIVETEQELRACYPVMKELRPHLASEDAFVAQMLRQYEQNYRILAVGRGRGGGAGRLPLSGEHRVRPLPVCG